MTRGSGFATATQAMRGLCAAIAVIGIGVPAIGRADELGPMMDRDRVVHCASDKEGTLWRLQCDPATKTCLYAPNAELDGDGDRAKPLERARECEVDLPFDRAKLEAEGYTMLPGRPDAPWGWMRDDRGRVFQVNFDLKKRLYFGVGYTPKKIL